MRLNQNTHNSVQSLHRPYYYPSQIDVTGTAYFIGQTIDSVSCICMVLAIGFSVDYSVHIAHAFSVAEGDRDVSLVTSAKSRNLT